MDDCWMVVGLVLDCWLVVGLLACGWIAFVAVLLLFNCCWIVGRLLGLLAISSFLLLLLSRVSN